MPDMDELFKKLESAEKKLQLLQDKEDIRDLMSRYAFNADLRRLDNFIKLFTDDMMFITDGQGPNAPPMNKHELKDYLDRALPKPHPGVQHLQLDYVITVNGDKATATGYQVLTGHNEGKFRINRCAMRTFDFRREGGVWKISKMVAYSTANAPDCQKQVPQTW
jgi:hypothetical protein